MVLILIQFSSFFIYPGWTFIFAKYAPFELKKNSLLTTLPSLPREWMVEFEFKPTNLDHNGWTSIFHMSTGDNSGTIGNRIPAVFYHPHEGGLTICSHNNKNSNYCQRFGSQLIGKWTKIRVSQELLDGKFRHRIFIIAFIFLRLRSYISVSPQKHIMHFLKI